MPEPLSPSPNLTQIGPLLDALPQPACLLDSGQALIYANPAWRALPRADEPTDLTAAVTIEGQVYTLCLKPPSSPHSWLENFWSANIIGIVVGDTGGQIYEANDYFLDLVGYTRAELEAGAIRWTELTVPEYLPRDRETIQRLLEGGVCTPYEKEYRRRDGGRVWVLLNITLLDRATQRLAAFVLNIRRTKQAEAALRQSELEMKKAQYVAQMGSWTWNIPTNQLTWSEEMYRIFGIDRQSFSGNLAEVVSRVIHPDDRAGVEARNAQVISESRPEPMEYRVIWPDGSIHYIYAEAGELIYDADRRPLLLTGIAQEITARKLAEQTLQGTIDELARSNAELEQFAYVASHDMMEPLRGITGMLQLLQRNYSDRLDARANHYIESAVFSAERMRGLLTDLLEFSRVGMRVRPFAPVDCNLLLEQALTNLSVALEESGGQIDCQPLPVVMGDASQLSQVFQNILANAIKFHSAEPPRIRVWAALRDGAWTFTVQDNGIGIDPRYFERIFVIFQRLHGRSEYPGTGIGLALCKKIIERHGGRIWVESQPGQGAAFSFTIPDRITHGTTHSPHSAG